MQKTPSRRNFPLYDRIIEVVDDTLTGEVLLDEALKMMKTSEKMSVSTWIDLMSGMRAPPTTTRVQPLFLNSSPCRNISPLTRAGAYNQARHGTS